MKQISYLLSKLRTLFESRIDIKKLEREWKNNPDAINNSRALLELVLALLRYEPSQLDDYRQAIDIAAKTDPALRKIKLLLLEPEEAIRGQLAKIVRMTTRLINMLSADKIKQALDLKDLAYLSLVVMNSVKSVLGEMNTIPSEVSSKGDVVNSLNAFANNVELFVNNTRYFSSKRAMDLFRKEIYGHPKMEKPMKNVIASAEESRSKLIDFRYDVMMLLSSR